jgi:outer membrane lipoprotein SlyB
MTKNGKYTNAAVGGGIVGAVVGGIVFGGMSSIALGFLAGVAGGIAVVKVAVKIAEMTDKPAGEPEKVEADSGSEPFSRTHIGPFVKVRPGAWVVQRDAAGNEV